MFYLQSVCDMAQRDLGIMQAKIQTTKRDAYTSAPKNTVVFKKRC